MKIKPITLEIEDFLWDRFKDKVPRKQTLNNKLVELVEEFIKEKK